METYVKLASVSDIPGKGMRGFTHAGRKIAIYRVGETFYATENVCSHEDARLTDGWLDTDDCTIECPLHGARFDLRSGQPLSLPAYQPIPVYAVRVEGDDIFVELPDSMG